MLNHNLYTRIEMDMIYQLLLGTADHLLNQGIWADIDDHNTYLSYYYKRSGWMINGSLSIVDGEFRLSDHRVPLVLPDALDQLVAIIKNQK